MRAVLAALFLLALPATALACINDRDVEREEHEFRSTYEEETTPAEETGSILAAGTVLPVAGSALGCLLLAGGLRRALRPAD